MVAYVIIISIFAHKKKRLIAHMRPHYPHMQKVLGNSNIES